MGVSTAAVVSQRLVEHGLAASTPVAVIENGTRPEQRIVTATLGELGDRLQSAGVTGPALIIVGEVARKALEGEETVLSAELSALPHALAV